MTNSTDWYFPLALGTIDTVDCKSRSLVHVTRWYEHLQSKPSIAWHDSGSVCRREIDFRSNDVDETETASSSSERSAIRVISNLSREMNQWRSIRSRFAREERRSRVRTNHYQLHLKEVERRVSHNSYDNYVYTCLCIWLPVNLEIHTSGTPKKTLSDIHPYIHWCMDLHIRMLCVPSSFFSSYSEIFLVIIDRWIRLSSTSCCSSLAVSILVICIYIYISMYRRIYYNSIIILRRANASFHWQSRHTR